MAKMRSTSNHNICTQHGHRAALSTATLSLLSRGAETSFGPLPGASATHTNITAEPSATTPLLAFIGGAAASSIGAVVWLGRIPPPGKGRG